MPFPTRATRATLVIVASLTVMSGTTVAPALPTMAAHFSGSEGNATELWTRLVLTGPALTIALCAWGMGRVVDDIGRLRPLIVALIAYALAGSAGLWLDSLPALVISRMALGVTVAAVMTSGTALAADYFAGAERERFLSRQAAFIGYGGVMFLILGGGLANVHWRAPFAVYLVSLPVLVMVMITLWEPDRHPVQTVCGDRPDHASAPPWLPLVLHVFAGLVFVAFYQVPSQLPFLVGQVRAGTPPWLVGVIVATLNLVSATTAMNYGRVRRACSMPTIMGLGFLILGLGLGGVYLSPSLSWAWFFTGLAGIGLGLGMPNLTVWILAITPPSHRGRAAGGQTAGIFLGQFAAPLLAEPLVQAFGVSSAFAGAAILMLVSAGACVMVRQRV